MSKSDSTPNSRRKKHSLYRSVLKTVPSFTRSFPSYGNTFYVLYCHFVLFRSFTCFLLRVLVHSGFIPWSCSVPTSRYVNLIRFHITLHYIIISSCAKQTKVWQGEAISSHPWWRTPRDRFFGFLILSVPCRLCIHLPTASVLSSHIHCHLLSSVLISSTMLAQCLLKPISINWQTFRNGESLYRLWSDVSR